MESSKQKRPRRGWGQEARAWCWRQLHQGTVPGSWGQAPVPTEGAGGRSRVLPCEALCSGNGFRLRPHLPRVSMRMSSLNVQPENGPERAGSGPTGFLRFPEMLLVPHPLRNIVWKRKVGLLKPWCLCFRLSCLSPVVVFCSNCHCGAGEVTVDGAGPQGCSNNLTQDLTGLTQGQ